MASSIQFRLNGRELQVHGVAAHTTVLDYLRSIGLRGAKEGCAEGECGACAILTVAPREGGSVYRSVNACLIPLPAVEGAELYTVEALANHGDLAEVQQAMVAHGGSQCGYCTPGFVVSLFAEQYRPDRADPCETHALSGNLCRCTGYRPIADACKSVGPAPEDAFRERLSHPAPIPAAVDYACARGLFTRPATLAECMQLLKDDPEARIVCGNTDLGLLTNLQDRRFPHLVSVEALPELRVLRDTNENIELGAALTLTEIGEQWTDMPSAMREWLPLFGSPLIRNRATLGGSLATASPIGDSAPLLLALGARVRIAGSAGERIAALDAFFTGYRSTVLAHNDVIVSVLIPKPLPEYVRFFKVAKRRTDDISTVAAGISVDAHGFRIGIAGVAATPVLITASDANAAARIIERTLRPMSDHRGSAQWRLQLALSLLEKFEYERTARVA